jgi:hypothetical protein
MIRPRDMICIIGVRMLGKAPDSLLYRVPVSELVDGDVQVNCH